MFLNNNFVWQIVVDLADSDSSVEEFEDASESFTGEDEMFIEDVGSKKLQPLSKLLEGNTITISSYWYS